MNERVRDRPEQLAPILSGINRAMQANNMAEASRLARSALDGGHVHPLLFNLRAVGERQNGRVESALADLLRAQDLHPRSAWTLSDIADCWNALGQPLKALAAADKALAADRGFSKAWFQKGLAHQALLELDKARSSYLAAVLREPQLAEAHARLANLAAEQDALDDARRHAAAALAACPGHPLATLALVAADIGEGKLDDAGRRLETLLSRRDVAPPLRAAACAQLGDLRDLQGKTGEAFRAYSDSRAIWAGFHVPRWQSAGSASGQEQVARLAAALARAPAGSGLPM